MCSTHAGPWLQPTGCSWAPSSSTPPCPCGLQHKMERGSWAGRQRKDGGECGGKSEGRRTERQWARRWHQWSSPGLLPSFVPWSLLFLPTQVQRLIPQERKVKSEGMKRQKYRQTRKKKKKRTQEDGSAAMPSGFACQECRTANCLPGRTGQSHDRPRVLHHYSFNITLLCDPRIMICVTDSESDCVLFFFFFFLSP